MSVEGEGDDIVTDRFTSCTPTSTRVEGYTEFRRFSWGEGREASKGRDFSYSYGWGCAAFAERNDRSHLEAVQFRDGPCINYLFLSPPLRSLNPALVRNSRLNIAH